MVERVDIEKILEAKEILNAINRMEFEDIQFYYEGIPLEVDESMLKQWKFIGLNNTDFITSEYYKGKKDEQT